AKRSRLLLFSGLACGFGFACRALSGFLAGFPGAFLQGIPEINGNAVLLHQVCERLVRQFLERPHAVARELLQLRKSVVVEFDQFAHWRFLTSGRNGNPQPPASAAARAAASGDGRAEVSEISRQPAAKAS